MNFKLKHFLFFLGFVLFTVSVNSQNKEIDSLMNVLSSYKQKDSLRVNLLNKIANTYCSIDIDKALKFIKESEEILSTINYTKGKAKAIYIKGLISETQSNYDEASKNYKNALKLFEDIDYEVGISDCLIGLGDLNNNQSNYNEAITYFNKAIKINKTIGNKKGVAAGYNSIGITYNSQGNYKDAITYFKKALSINTDINYEQGIANGINNVGIIYYRQGNYSSALEYFQKGLSINEAFGDEIKISASLMNIGVVYSELENFDKAIEFNKKALKIATKNDNKKNIATLNSNLGIFYNKKKKHDTSIDYLKKALYLSKEIDFKFQTGLCLNNLGDVYLSLKDYSQALTYFEEAKNINLENEHQMSLTHSYIGIAKVYMHYNSYDKALINALKSKKLSSDLKLLDYKRDAEQLLSEIYENKGNYKKAFESNQQFKILNDSLFNKENIEKITQIEYEYKYKQALDSASIRELQLTKTVKSTSENLKKSQRNLLLGVIGFLVIAMLMGAIIFIQKLRNVQTKTQNIIVEQKLLRSQMTPHFIFNSLSVLQGMILNKEEKNSVTYLSKFSKLLRTILENSRHKIVVLSEELSAINSYMALQNLDVNPPYEYKLTIDPNIDKSALKIPPMLIQPFIENAIEHAFPNKKENKEISIDLTFLDKKLVCTISDNGVGINVEKQNSNKNKSSLATAITAERLEMLSKEFNTEGSITIENRKQFGEQGTLVTLVIPYKN